MARYTGPKAKIARREGSNIFGLPKITRALTKRNYPPGIHGPAQAIMRSRQTEYGTQLRAKQKMKRTYGLNEKQFKNLYVKATHVPGDAGFNLNSFLETRLDNVIYRLGFAASRAQARQIVSHALVTVNGKKLNIPSYHVHPGDELAIRDKSVESQLFAEIKENKNKAEIPAWLSSDPKKLRGKVVSAPNEKDLEGHFDLKLIIEFYSR